MQYAAIEAAIRQRPRHRSVLHMVLTNRLLGRPEVRRPPITEIDAFTTPLMLQIQLIAR
jgi:hypothetical protein